MEHLGKLKSHLYRVQTSVLPIFGSPIIINDKLIGHVVVAATRAKNQIELLIHCKDEFIDAYRNAQTMKQ